MAKTHAHKFPTIYARASNGKTKKWSIRVEWTKRDGPAEIIMESGYDDGKQAVNKRVVTQGKNLGKKNATTPLQQALSDARSKVAKQFDKGYVEVKSKIDSVAVRPMLAQTYSKIENTKSGLKEKGGKKHITLPAYVQPKLDGVRCLSEKKERIVYTSRQGKEFVTLGHLDKEVDLFIGHGVAMPDGEIYDNENMTFQEMISAVKKLTEKSKFLKYHIYDMVDTKITFEKRHELIKDIFDSHKFEHLVYVPTYEVNSEEEILEWHRIFVEMGYEGVIIRNRKGLYVPGHRSKDLQKWKYFIDEEFEIVRVREAYNDPNTAVFICKTKESKEFECRPRGTREQRAQYLKDSKKLIGLYLTVRYQEETDEGKPRFPVGVAVRDYE